MQLSSYQRRVGGMRRLLMDINDQERQAGASSVRSGDCIAFEGVRVVTPAGNQLVEDLTFQVQPGHNMLITGPNGAGRAHHYTVL